MRVTLRRDKPTHRALCSEHRQRQNGNRHPERPAQQIRCGKQPDSPAYHDSCHLAHGQKIRTQPRDLLRAIPGLKVVNLPESDWCCGSAGIYNLVQPEMAAQLLQRKLDHIKSTGAQIVATANPGCLLQIINGAKQQGLQLRVIHPISLLAQAFRKL